MHKKWFVAADLGTSRISLALLDAEMKETVSVISVRNEQERFGHDVISRMEYCAGKETGQSDLRAAVTDSFREGIRRLKEAAGNAVCASLEAFCVERMAVAGNTTMTYFLLGLDPAPIMKPPFEIPVREWEILPGEEIGLSFVKEVFIFPCPANYFGGDIVSGIYGISFDQEEDGSALFDIGINSEFVIKKGETLYGGSCAAGPAFEGRLEMPGETDAPREEPAALQGSEMITLTARLLERGALSRRARLQKGKDESVVDYIVPMSGRTSTAYACREGALLTQAALAGFIQSKASEATMIEYICETAGCEPEELKKIILTGQLGLSLCPADAVSIGMLPPADDIRTAKQASLDGCRKYLLSADPGGETARILEICRKIRFVQLKEVEDYLELMIPHLYF